MEKLEDLSKSANNFTIDALSCYIKKKLIIIIHFYIY